MHAAPKAKMHNVQGNRSIRYLLAHVRVRAKTSAWYSTVKHRDRATMCISWLLKGGSAMCSIATLLSAACQVGLRWERGGGAGADVHTHPSYASPSRLTSMHTVVFIVFFACGFQSRRLWTDWENGLYSVSRCLFSSWPLADASLLLSSTSSSASPPLSLYPFF